MPRPLPPYIWILLMLFGTPALAQSDGEVRGSQNLEAFDAEQERWLPLEAFWRSYAARRGGLTWGEGSAYPPYGEVSKLDTFLVQVPQGKCLMEFFHQRWRRANDVRRWGEAHNAYGGCPHVFD